MDSGLLWSTPAERRSRIELRRLGIPAAFAGNRGTELPTRRGDGAFPGYNAFIGHGALLNPKRRWVGTPGPSRGQVGHRGFRSVPG